MAAPDGLCLSCGEPASEYLFYCGDTCASWGVMHALSCPERPCRWCHWVACIEEWTERVAKKARLRESTE